MNRKLSILFSVSEATPYVKEGGLGDVARALPRALEARGHNVRMVLPLYYSIDRDRHKLKPLPGTLVVPMGIIGDMYCRVFEAQLPDSGISVYFLEHHALYGREGIYGNGNEGFMDNDNRFVFLSRATLELCRMLDFKPNLVHAHDWQTAAVPVFMNTLYRHDRYVGDAASVLSLHNLQHQGSFYPGLMDVLGIGWEHFTFLGLEKDNHTNLLKGGLYHATKLSTVSEGYSREIQTPEFGWGLDGVIRERAADLVGILNGVDYTEWNPESDPLIPARYSAADLSGKRICKEELQRHFGLPVRPEAPLFGMVSRLVKQKGIDVLAAAIHRILDLDLQIVLLGSGEPWTHFYFGDIAARYPGKFRCHIGFSNPLAHLVEAGSDFFLMPSAFEPCGLNQMYSLRYGTIPVVRAVGGLNDSVEHFEERTLAGTGFTFRALTPDALVDTVGWAVWTWYHNERGMASLIRNGMARRFTWDRAAEKYEQLYYWALEKRLGWEEFRKRFLEP
jgi:starch synthase